jgi:hypothetical protein
MHLNDTDNKDCPCYINKGQCPKRFVGCHSKCIDYIDWQQIHEARINVARANRKQQSVCFEGKERRNKSLGRKALNYGRKKRGS